MSDTLIRNGKTMFEFFSEFLPIFIKNVEFVKGNHKLQAIISLQRMADERFFRDEYIVFQKLLNEPFLIWLFMI